MRVAIDIDGTITEHPEFFAFLTASLKGNHEIFIITGRGPEMKEVTEEQLRSHNIYFDHMYMIGVNWKGKGAFCEEKQIDILFEDMDEFIAHIPSRTLVFKVRNGGNWCFTQRDWR